MRHGLLNRNDSLFVPLSQSNSRGQGMAHGSFELEELYRIRLL